MFINRSLLRTARAGTVLVGAGMAMACELVATTPAALDAYQVATMVVVSKSDYKSTTDYLGPEIRQPKEFLSDDRTNVRIRSVEDGGRWSHQLYVTHYYLGEWLFIESAGFKGGQRADLIAIDREIVSCGTSQCHMEETVAITLDEADLIDGTVRGIGVALFSKTGQEIPLSLSPVYVQGYLSRLRPQRYPLPPPATN